MPNLDASYRRLLRWYPKSWRAAHGEALLGALLDDAEDHGRTTIERGEWRSFAAAGTTARVDRVLMQPTRDAAATVALSMGTGASLITFLISSWAPWGMGRYLPALGFPRFGPFYDLGPLLTALWVLAFISAWAGHWWLGRVALLVSAAIAVVLPTVQAIPPHFLSPDIATVTYSVVCALLAALGTPRTRLTLLGATAGWATLAWTCYAYQRPPGIPIWEPTAALWDRPIWPSSIVVLAVAIVVLLAIARLWTPAFTILLTAIPMAASLDAEVIQTTVLRYETAGLPLSPWLFSVPLAVGLVTLVLASLGVLTLPRWRRAPDRQPSARS